MYDDDIKKIIIIEEITLPKNVKRKQIRKLVTEV